MAAKKRFPFSAAFVRRVLLPLSLLTWLALIGLSLSKNNGTLHAGGVEALTNVILSGNQ